MRIRLIIAIAALLMTALSTEPVVAPERALQVKSGYAPVNGLRMDYEIHGIAKSDKPPLVLLHGGGSTIDTSFGKVLGNFARTRQVIAFEQQGHGHTADIDRPEHAVEMFRLLPHTQLAVLPGTDHMTIVQRADWQVSMIEAFLDAPTPNAHRRERNQEEETVMATVFASRTLSVAIRRPPDKVYEFASNPENLPRWAKGLGASVRKQGTDWIVDTPQGQVKIRFAEKNTFGVMDHYVTTATGIEVYVPMRVLSNGAGSEVLFTLFRLPDTSDERYAEDARLVERDLRTLKDLLEE